jgi:hypothetical protein
MELMLTRKDGHDGCGLCRPLLPVEYSPSGDHSSGWNSGFMKCAVLKGELETVRSGEVHRALQHSLAKYGRLEGLRAQHRTETGLQLIHRGPEGTASLHGNGVGSLDADRRRWVDGKRHRRLVKVDAMMACWVVLVCMAGVHRDSEVQVRTADRCGRCRYRWVGLHRRDLGLRGGAGAKVVR